MTDMHIILSLKSSTEIIKKAYDAEVKETLGADISFCLPD
jgi:hypothetical protein